VLGAILFFIEISPAIADTGLMGSWLPGRSARRAGRRLRDFAQVRM